MKTAASHYDTHLGPLYSWMLGDLDAAFARSAAEIRDMHLPAAAGGIAVDLGAGLGLHAVALAQAGFTVVAIDSCQFLLNEMRSHVGSLPISAIRADLQDFRAHVLQPADVIVCAGDTLTHLPTVSAVQTLLADAADALNPGGVFAATFRDYASSALRGEDRFILVRRDEQRILTCFLEYHADHVTVHDLLTQREDGEWRQQVSSYPKLRLAPDWVAAQLAARGLAVRRETAPAGMVRVIGTKAQRGG
jgi:SAM-dependent methyltransferase